MLVHSPKLLGDDTSEELALFWVLATKFYQLADVSLSPWGIWVQELTEAVGDAFDLAKVGPDESAFKARRGHTQTIRQEMTSQCAG